MSDLLLTPDEVRAIAGGLQLARCQLRKLHAAGFWRARLGTDGKVLLERAHYNAVCAGALPPGQPVRDTARPQLRSIKAA